MILQPPPPPEFERAKSGLYVPRPTPPVLPYAVGMLGAAKAAFRQAAGGGGGGGSPTLVNQHLEGLSSFGGKTFTLSFTPTAGNVLVALYGATNDHQFNSISSTNTTWTKQYGPSGLSDSCGIATGIVGSSPGTSVTVSHSGSGIGGICIQEWSGLDTSSLVDGSVGTGSGTGTTLGTQSVTPTGGGYVVLFSVCGAHSDLTGGPSGSWNAAMPYNGNGVNYTRRAPSAYLVVTSASGSYSTSWTYGSSSTWTGAIIALNVA